LNSPNTSRSNKSKSPFNLVKLSQKLKTSRSIQSSPRTTTIHYISDSDSKPPSLPKQTKFIPNISSTFFYDSDSSYEQHKNPPINASNQHIIHTINTTSYNPPDSPTYSESPSTYVSNYEIDPQYEECFQEGIEQGHYESEIVEQEAYDAGYNDGVDWTHDKFREELESQN